MEHSERIPREGHTVSEQTKKDRKNWTILEKTESQLAEGIKVDLKKSTQYQIIVIKKKEFLFSF